MNNELVINSTPLEVTIALLEDKRLVELNSEKRDQRFSVGDIYLGRVKKLIPGLNAAFVDVGHEKDAFLHYLDLGPQVQSLAKLIKLTTTGKKPDSMLADFQQEPDINKGGKITSVLTINQWVLVQVAKEPISSKGPRITSEISLAGRYVVMVPFSDTVSISQKIKSAEERQRLKRLAMSIKPKGFGLIIRTVADGKKVAELDKDIQELVAKWKGCFEQLATAKPPMRILGELNRTSTILRDLLNPNFNNIHVNDATLFDEIKSYISGIAPEQTEIVKLYKGKIPIFENFGIDKQIKSSFGKTALGVEVLQGHARIISPWAVELSLADGSKQTLTTRSIVIAAGASPFVPTIPGLQEAGFVTSDTVWGLTTLPKRLVVLGGGPIGCELAQSFARLGSQVTQVEMQPRVMLREDPEVSALVAQSLRDDGVELLTGHQALRCEVAGGIKRLVVQHPGGERTVEFEALLCAVGRSPRVSGYGLEELGIPLTAKKTIETNAWMQTLYPNIYAVGDVAGPFQLTHTAAHQAWYAAVNALFGRFKRFKVDYSVIPWATFTDPEVARVGLSEAEATEQGIAFEVTRYGMDELDRAIADGTAHGFVKVLTVPGKDRILGATIVGEHAGDLIVEFVLAMKHGLGLNKVLATIHIYPTLAEANKYAAGEWKRAHAPKKLLAWVERFHTWERT